MCSAHRLDDPCPAAARYNCVRHFDAQVHSILPEHLLGIGQILHKHGMHRLLRALLLHRHDELHSDMVMVHSYPDALTEVCQMTPLKAKSDDFRFSPASFRFNEAREVEPFDFVEGDSPISTTGEVWEELRNFIEKHDLRETIGISRAPDQAVQWVEYLHPSGTGTIARAIASEKEHDWSAGVVTEWAFYEEDGAVRIRATRKCNPPPEGGGHVRS